MPVALVVHASWWTAQPTHSALIGSRAFHCLRPVERRALSFLTFILRTVVDFSPFVRRLRKVGIDALKNEVTSFEVSTGGLCASTRNR